MLILISIGLLFIEFHKNIDDSLTENYEPETLVMVPCRGMDFSLEDNLKSIKNQKYPKYRMICIVDSNDDPSLEIIKRLNIDYVLSDYSCKKCSGKVKALCSAIDKFNNFPVYVIADSDILVTDNWLSNLVKPLKNENNGLSTTFPYFKPKNGFWSRIKEIWGFVGMGLMESKLTRFGWGGSLAFKGSLISNQFNFFSEHISDDTALTKICKNKNLNIAYVKSSMPVVNSPEKFSEFAEWANRQTALSISSSKKIFYYGMLFYMSYILLFFSAIFMGIFYSYLFFIFLIPSIIYIANILRRLDSIKFASVIGAIMLPFIYVVNLLIANHMKNIQWRGRTYSIEDKNLL